MYTGTTAAFRNALQNTYQIRALKADITYKTKTGTETTKTLTQNDIVQGSFSISQSCIPGTVLEFGGVVSGQLEFSIWNEDKSWSGAKLKGATVKPYVGLLIGNSYEWCPMGVFYIDSTSKTYGEVIQISAMDGLMKFEKAVDYSGSIKGVGKTFRQIFDLACSTCGVTAVSGTTSIIPERLAVAEEWKDDSATWRDIISWIAISSGCFCKMTRTGLIELVTIKKTTDRMHTVSYNGTRMSLETDEIIEIEGVAYYNDETGNSVYGSFDNVIIIPDNALFQSMTNTERITMNNYLYTNYVRDGLAYYPFSLSYIGSPIIDAGDWVTLDNTDEGTIESLITDATFIFDGRSTLEAVGLDELDKNFMDKNNRRPISGGGGNGGTTVLSEEVPPNLLRRSIAIGLFDYSTPDIANTTQVKLHGTNVGICGTGGNSGVGFARFGSLNTSRMESGGNFYSDPLVGGETYTLSALIIPTPYLASTGNEENTVVKATAYYSSGSGNYLIETDKGTSFYNIINTVDDPIKSGDDRANRLIWITSTFTVSDTQAALPANGVFTDNPRININVGYGFLIAVKLEKNDKRTIWTPHSTEKFLSGGTIEDRLNGVTQTYGTENIQVLDPDKMALNYSLLTNEQYLTINPLKYDVYIGSILYRVRLTQFRNAVAGSKPAIGTVYKELESNPYSVEKIEITTSAVTTTKYTATFA